jgi:hypothetical protein
VETILAYEPDRNSCDNEVRKKGYANAGSRTSLFIWSEKDQKIEEYTSKIAFSIPRELLLFQGKPLLFWQWWGDVDGKTRYVAGRIVVNYFITGGAPYGSLERCQIGFELTPAIFKRMVK